MADVVMPRLSDSMEEGTILKWLVEPGALVTQGEPIVEIETDKATLTYVSDADGPLEIVAAEGDTLAIGALIARIGGPGPAVASARPAPPSPARAATPAVTAETGTAKGDVTRVELTRSQRLIARRMAESKATVPEFTLTSDVDMTTAVDLRAQLQAARNETVPTYNDMVVKASALALQDFPRANGSYRDGRFELYSRINVGVVVAAEDALVVPTVFDAESQALTQIAATTRVLAERVRSGAITPPELSGGTFTVSNLGMFGVSSFTAVIYPPQAAVLAVGAMVPRAVPVGDRIAVGRGMPVTLACDHRILYGAYAARFLARIRELLENPAALLL